MVHIEAVDLFMQWCEKYGKILKYKVFLLGKSSYWVSLPTG